jgi:hypothetical protein
VHQPPPPLSLARFDETLRSRGPRFGITSAERTLDLAS